MPSRREDEQLTEYLIRLRAALEGLPVSERQEAYRELAQHVEALAEAEVSAAGERESAIPSALQKFGNPETVGQRVVKEYWSRMFRLQPKRRVYQLPDALLGALMGLCGGISVPIEHTFQFSGYVLAGVAAAYGSLLGIATGWQWARLKMRNGFERHQKTSSLHWVRSHPALSALIGLELLVLAIFGARIFWAADFTDHWTLSAQARHQVDRSWEFVTILVLSDLLSAALFKRFFLFRQSDGRVSKGIGK